MAKAKTLLAALTVSVAAALAPATASAQSYDYYDCKKSDKDAQAIGGLVGGLLGAVAGHEIAGRGETTEGAVIGGLIGAAAGAGIGDDRRNCTREATGRTRTSLQREADYRADRAYGGQVHTVGHNGYRNRGYNNRNYRQDFGGYTSRRDVRYRIEQLKDEDRRLKRRAKYEYRPWIDRRRDEIRWEVKRLKRIEDRLKDRRDYRRDNYRDYDRGYRNNRSRHYHGSNVCYSSH